MSEAAPLLYDAAGRPLDAKGNPVYPKLPLATYFVNAGLSDADARAVEREVLRRVLRKLRARATNDRPDERRRYMTDAQHRIRVNRELVGETLLELGFSREELLTIEQGTQIGLVREDPRPATATVWGVDGREQVFTMQETEDRRPDGSERVVVTDERTGEKTVV